MLKVVGASWYRTKVSSVIILSALLLSIGALFILNIERPRLESVYCATAYWTSSTGYRVEFWGQGHNLEKIPRGVARVCYKGPSSEAEWPHMEIESNHIYTDKVQAFSAGILEGSLLWKSIYQQWMETIVQPCGRDENTEKFCEWLRDVVEQNYESLKKQFEERLNTHMDSYWHQIYLFYQQLEGIEFGWRYGLKRSNLRRSGLEIPLTDLLILNLGADVKVLENCYLEMTQMDREELRFRDHQTQAVVMNIENDSDNIKLSLDHLMHETVKSSHRILKKYKLNYRMAPPGKHNLHNTLVPGHSIVLTSFSGVISSPDEFYAITGRHSRLTVIGVDLKYEPKLHTDIDLLNTVFLSARVMAVNRLAVSSRSWAKLMKRDPHVGAVQWVVADRKILHTYNSFLVESETELLQRGEEVVGQISSTTEPTTPLADRISGLVWVVDLVPGRLHGEDITSTLLERKSFRLNGLPHFEESRQASGLTFASNDVATPDQPASFDYLKQSDEETTHTVKFYAIVSTKSDYSEGMMVIHDGQEEVEPENKGAVNGGAETEVNSVPIFNLDGFSSKWTWA